MYKKFVASIMTTLMVAMTLVSPALGATALNSYPTFLGKSGNFYVVVGSGAAASDVAGAIDIASNLAQLSYTPVSTGTTAAGTGTSTVAGFSGLERDIQVQSPVTVNSSSTSGGGPFPASVQSYNFAGLKRGTFTFNGQTYNYHEEVDLGSGVLVEHNSTVNYVNGTETLVVPSGGVTGKGGTTGGLEYRLVFDSAITSGLGTSTTPNYTYTMTLPIAGQNVVVTGTDAAGSFSALSGNISNAVSSTNPVSFNGCNVYVLDGSSGSWAKIQIKDPSGNVVVTDILNLNQQNSYTCNGQTFQVRAINVYSSTVSNSASAQLAVGTNVAVTFPSSESVDPKFQIGGTSSPWYMFGHFSLAGQVATNDYIAIAYDAQNTTYVKSGSYLPGPNNYFSFGLSGQLPVSWATITTSTLTGGSTIYSTTSATTSLASGLSGFKIHSDTAGTVFPPTANTSLITNNNVSVTSFSSTGWQDAYLLFGLTATGLGGPVYFAHYDPASSKIVQDLNVTVNGSGNPGILYGAFKLQYGGSGSGVYLMNFTVQNNTQAGGIVTNAQVYSLSGPVSTGLGATNVTYPFTNDTVWSTTNAPTFHLGVNKGVADAGDVVLAYEGATNNQGQTTQDLLTDGQIIVKAPNSNSGADQAVFQIPSDFPKNRYLLGSFGGTTTTTTTTTASGTVNQVVPVIVAVAKLDTELLPADKTNGLVSVGGPCINKVTADAMGLTYPACGSASGLSAGQAVIQVYDNTYTTGKQVVVVAGYDAAGTRLASSVLQNYATRLSTITGSKANVTGSVASPAVTPS